MTLLQESVKGWWTITELNINNMGLQEIWEHTFINKQQEYKVLHQICNSTQKKTQLVSHLLKHWDRGYYWYEHLIWQRVLLIRLWEQNKAKKLDHSPMFPSPVSIAHLVVSDWLFTLASGGARERETVKQTHIHCRHKHNKPVCMSKKELALLSPLAIP